MKMAFQFRYNCVSERVDFAVLRLLALLQPPAHRSILDKSIIEKLFQANSRAILEKSIHFGAKQPNSTLFRENDWIKSQFHNE
ncbi:hypothetical protein [Paenibacillus taihuensis]|uniref:hypothetical protein n=1 Tax=Paenibacillus taihuensis TaxID=1156355 RepID=UPI0011C05406|nr:hypothetical protein [Paenibacillus taihuensis]